MIRPVVKKGDPVLNQVSRDVADISESKALITDLWDTLTAVQQLYDFKRGSGLAAPQIGELRRVSVIEFENHRYTLINPVINSHSDEKALVREGCLSFFNYRGKASRYKDITVTALDEHGVPFSVSSNGDLNLASLIQHEIDHLDGLLYESAMPEGESLRRHPEMPFIP